MSIATMKGDEGQTSLVGGVRVSKARCEWRRTATWTSSSLRSAARGRSLTIEP